MDLDLWSSDFQLAMEWELETSAVQADGQLVDLKPTVDIDDSHNLQPRGVPFEVDSFIGEDALGSEWMENSDLSSFFDALGDERLSLESTLVDNVDPVSTNELSSVDVFSFFKQRQGEDVLQTQTDCFLTPPESPEQVAPSLGLEETLSTHILQPSFIHSEDLSVDNGVFAEDSIILTEIDLINFGVCSSSDSLIDICGDESSVSITYNSDSSPSFSSPSSPDTSQSTSSSIIQSSPELYKVISTSTFKEKFSPYPQPKAKEPTNKSPKAPRRTKNPAQPVPEHIIMGQFNKKDRKKLQNKNAAIRYRMKKKEETDVIRSEENVLEDINSTLKSKVDDLEREVKYMKNLMTDVLKAQGISFN